MDRGDHHVRRIPDQRLRVPLAQPWLFFVGMGVIVIGAITGKVMAMMGMGSPVSHDHDRDRQYDDNTSA